MQRVLDPFRFVGFADGIVFATQPSIRTILIAWGPIASAQDCHAHPDWAPGFPESCVSLIGLPIAQAVLQAAMGNAVSCCTGCCSGSLKISSNSDRTWRYRWHSEQPQMPRSVAWPIKYSSCSRMTSLSSAGSGTLGRLHALCVVVCVPSSSVRGAIAPPPSSALIDAPHAEWGPFGIVNIGQRLARK